MNALTRVLRENGRKSFELTIHILSTLYQISKFPTYHKILTNIKAGDLCLKIVEFEVARLQKLSQEDSEFQKKSLQDVIYNQDIILKCFEI